MVAVAARQNVEFPPDEGGMVEGDEAQELPDQHQPPGRADAVEAGRDGLLIAGAVEDDRGGAAVVLR